jgi:hypothetical protein
VQTLGLLRETSILTWHYSPRPVHSQCAGWLSLDIMCHLWNIPKTDTFTYTFSQLLRGKLFVIMAELAYAADLISAGPAVAVRCMLEMPMAEVLERIPLDQATKAVLLGQPIVLRSGVPVDAGA